jgi:xylan 1,4-beta-xylosidase
VEIENLPFDGQPLVLHHYRIDQGHSNAYAEWLRQERPMYPAPGQRAAIKARDGLELLEPPQKLLPDAGKVRLNFSLPVHGISLLIVEPSEW